MVRHSSSSLHTPRVSPAQTTHSQRRLPGIGSDPENGQATDRQAVKTSLDEAPPDGFSGRSGVRDVGRKSPGGVDLVRGADLYGAGPPPADALPEPPFSSRSDRGQTMRRLDEIERRRQLLARDPFQLPSPTDCRRRSGSAVDRAGEPAARHLAEAGEKRSMLKRLDDTTAREDRPRRVSFNLEHDSLLEALRQREKECGDDVARPSPCQNDVQDRPPARRVHERPQSAKHRKRAGDGAALKESSPDREAPGDVTAPRKSKPEAKTDGKLKDGPAPKQRLATKALPPPEAADFRRALLTDVKPLDVPSEGQRPSASAGQQTVVTDVTVGRPTYTRGSLIHNVSLATKSAHQKRSAASIATADRIEARNRQEQRSYLGISCHDWSCNCAHRDCVTRYDLKKGEKHFGVFGPITVKKDFIIPEGCRLPPGGARGEADVRGFGHRLTKNQTGGIPKTDPERGRNTRKDMEDLLAKKPISVRGGFRISGPHWISKNHTQRWPWKGTMWIALCGDEITTGHNRRSVKGVT